MVKIAPSILSADFTKLGEEIKAIEKAGADWVHVDVMDGHFVPNLTFGPFIVKQIRPLTKLPFDVHLMVHEPEKMLPWFIDAGADSLTVHFEACKDLTKTLKEIKSKGLLAGVSIKPKTKAEVLKPYLKDIDLVLVMSVEPGFGGQSFMPDQVEKIRQLKQMKKDLLVEVDGGINEKTAKVCIEAGADILVAGSYIFKSSDYNKIITSLR